MVLLRGEQKKGGGRWQKIPTTQTKTESSKWGTNPKPAGGSRVGEFTSEEESIFAFQQINNLKPM